MAAADAADDDDDDDDDDMVDDLDDVRADGLPARCSCWSWLARCSDGLSGGGGGSH